MRSTCCPVLGGSYEESPPSLIDVGVRDRRWCQGNLQHVRVMFAVGPPPRLAPAFRDRHLGLPRLAAVDGATARRHRAGAAVGLFPAGIFHLRGDAVSRSGRASTPSARSICSPSPWRSCSRRKRSGLLLALFDGRTRRACGGAIRLDHFGAGRGAHVGPVRADHDAGPVGLGDADPVRPRHRLEPAAARRRVDPASRTSCSGTARTSRSAS